MSEAPATTQSSAPPSRTGRIVLWIFGSILGVVLLLVIAASIYTTTDDFQKRVGAQVVSILEDATGGRVELGGKVGTFPGYLWRRLG